MLVNYDNHGFEQGGFRFETHGTVLRDGKLMLRVVVSQFTVGGGICRLPGPAIEIPCPADQTRMRSGTIRKRVLAALRSRK